MKEPRLGVFICHCGGNISDVVDVEKVRQAVEGDPGVKVAQTHMFTCSEAAQQEMIRLIQEHDLNGLVIASCSPRLHQETFRQMARRAGLNPYRYVQVNIREQCSWAHPHHPEEATRKAVALVKGGIARALRARSLEPIVIKTRPEAVVIGAGIAGLEAALGLSRMGIKVHLVEKEDRPGGLLRDRGPIFPTDQKGRDLVEHLWREIRRNVNIRTYFGSHLCGKEGVVGDFRLKICRDGEEKEIRAGAIVVATGARPHTPQPGEWGYGSEGVCTLYEFLLHLAEHPEEKPLSYRGRRVRRLVYIYCVGSREPAGEKARTYCSRYCCTAALYTACLVHSRWPEVTQVHLYRDIRSYGKYEKYYRRALGYGSVFMRYSPQSPPEIHPGGRLRVRVKDLLTAKEEVELEADLVCLVTGLEPVHSPELLEHLKLPVGKEGFFQEVHPKLRPVETMADGVFICGCAQGPRTAEESATSGLAAAAKVGALLLAGEVKREPLVAEVIEERCDGCGECLAACPYGALELSGDRVRVRESLCKGEGACVPVCPQQALQVRGYEHETVKALIQSLAEGWADA